MTATDAHDVLAVVIGRSGSKGLPGKNARELGGRPMICHSIGHAQTARHVRTVIVSTDGAAIATAAASMGVDVIDRPVDLANDTATVDSAVRHAVTASASEAGTIVILYANVPVRPADLIDTAIETLWRTGADSVQSYHDVQRTHPYWMVRLGADGEITPFVENAVYRRQDLPPLYLPDGGVIAVTRASLFTVVEGEPHAFLGRDRRGIVSSGVVIDIDDDGDLRHAEAHLLMSEHRHADR